jgi:hypothetical protein
MSAEDPRELARRLAEEARRRLQSNGAPAAPPPAAPPPPEKSLAERAGPARSKSALDAIAAAREAERSHTPGPSSATTPPTTHRRSTPGPTPPARTADPRTRPSAYPEARPAAAAGEGRTPESVLAAQLPGARAERPIPVSNADVFRALWLAHRARALHEGDGALLATASVLVDAIDRLPAGRLFAARVSLGGDTWAAWVDTDRGVLLGLVRPAEVYLAGL